MDKSNVDNVIEDLGNMNINTISSNDKYKIKLDKLLLNNCNFNTDQFIEIYEWCKVDIFVDKNKTKVQLKEEEKLWGNKMLNKTKITKQWTTLLGEKIVFDVLKLLGHTNVHTNTKKQDTNKDIVPDIETDCGIFEVKTRNWKTEGTAGEKVFGVPFKYSSVPRIYGKPLFIVLVGAQEIKDNTPEIFSMPTPEKKKIIEFYESMNIYFIKFTDLLKKLDDKLKLYETNDE